MRSRASSPAPGQGGCLSLNAMAPSCARPQARQQTRAAMAADPATPGARFVGAFLFSIGRRQIRGKPVRLVAGEVVYAGSDAAPSPAESTTEFVCTVRSVARHPQTQH